MISSPNSNPQTSAGQEIRPALDTICTTLGDILSEGVDVHRCLAAKALGKIGAPQSVQPLIKSLLDEDEDVRSDAAQALLEMGDSRAGDQLLENLLGDPCTDVKMSAIDMLVKLEDQRVVPWLRRMVVGRDEEIAWDEEEFYQSGWDDWVEIQVKAINALSELKVEDAVPDIVAAIQGEDSQDMVESAFKALSAIGPMGIEALAEFIDQPDVRLRRRAASVLAIIDSEVANNALQKALVDPESEVRLAALRARAKVTSTDPALTAMIEDEDEEIRCEAIKLIGHHYPDVLVPLIDDPALKVQEAALTAIIRTDGSIADEALIENLCQKMDCDDNDVTVAASRALGQLAPSVANSELTKLLANSEQPLAVRLGALRGLIAIGNDEIVASLIAFIDDEQRQIRLEVMSALAKFADAKSQWPNMAGDALLSALAGEYFPEIDPSTEDENAALSDDDEEEDVEIEEGASQILVEVTDEEALETMDDGDIIREQNYPKSTLDSILDDAPGMAAAVGLPDKGIELSPTDLERLAIAKRAIGKKRKSIEPKVVRHEDIRQFAARVLGDRDHEDVANGLSACLEIDDKELNLAAADSLARIAHRTGSLSENIVGSLLGKMATDDENLKILLIRALAVCDGEEVVEQLRAQLGHEEWIIRAESVRALKGRSEFETELEGLLNDPNPSVRLNVAEILATNSNLDNIDRLAEFAFSFEGYHARHTARLLRKLDADRANAAFLHVLDDPQRRRVWAVAIEALEELNQSQDRKII